MNSKKKFMITLAFCFSFIAVLGGHLHAATTAEGNLAKTEGEISRLLREAGRTADAGQSALLFAQAQQRYQHSFEKAALEQDPELHARIAAAFQEARTALEQQEPSRFSFNRVLIAKSLLNIAFLEVSDALQEKDIERAKTWFQLRESRFKYEAKASPALKAMVDMEKKPELLPELATTVETDLTEIYIFHLKTSLSSLQEVLGGQNKDLKSALEKTAETMGYFYITDDYLQDKLGVTTVGEMESSLTDIRSLLQRGENTPAAEKAREFKNRLAKLAGPADLELLRSKAGKIITLLDYIARNYTRTVKDGEIYDPVEYRELVMFAKEAQDRLVEIEFALLNIKDPDFNLPLAVADIRNGLRDKVHEEKMLSLIERVTGTLRGITGIESPKTRQSLGKSDDYAGLTAEVQAALADLQAAYEQGDRARAADLAFNTYFIFEPLEGPLSVKDRNLVRKFEAEFAGLRGSVEGGRPVSEVAEKAQLIVSDLEKALTILQERDNNFSVFFQSLTIILREGLEAIIIIGALAAYISRTGNRKQVQVIYGGAALALVASLLTAWLIENVFHLKGAGQEIIEGATMLLAVVVLFNVSYWLLSKVEGQRWQQFIQSKMAQSVGNGSLLAMGTVSFLAVYREGFETILFYKALGSISGGFGGSVGLGFLLGSAILLVIFLLFYRYGIKLPIKTFFTVTGAILYYMAFSFAGHGIAELQEGGVISVTSANFIPRIDFIGLYPTWETLIVQGALLLAQLAALIYLFFIRPKLEVNRGLNTD